MRSDGKHPVVQSRSRTREGAPARRRGHLCSGALAAPVLAALCCALSGLARTAAAQQAATITATATVTGVVCSVPSAARPLRCPAGGGGAGMPRGSPSRELGVLRVEGAAGAQVRLESPAAAGREALRSGSYARLPSIPAGVIPASAPASPVGAARVVRASIAFVAN